MVSLTLLDLSKTFDTVNFDQEENEPREILIGVPQGSIPNHLLFGIITSHLIYVILHCRLFTFADYVSLHLSFPSTNREDLVEIRSDLNAERQRTKSVQELILEVRGIN